MHHLKEDFLNEIIVLKQINHYIKSYKIKQIISIEYIFS